jgi:uncharacterized SAM-binding protein YcdF (DUF218 family)
VSLDVQVPERREQVSRPRRLRRRWWVALGAVFVVVVLFVVGTLVFIVKPATDQPRHVDAIISLGGGGPRLKKAVELAKQGYAPNLIVSTPGQGCPDPISGVRIICFYPHPTSTQGEAREASAIAKQNGWTSLMLVTTTEQITRARIRMERCTNADVAYISTGGPSSSWSYVIPYEWGALAKAEIWQRGC